MNWSRTAFYSSKGSYIIENKHTSLSGPHDHKVKRKLCVSSQGAGKDGLTSMTLRRETVQKWLHLPYDIGQSLRSVIFRAAFHNGPHVRQPRLERRYSYRGADRSLARPTSRCISFDGENISFDASLVIYIYIVLMPCATSRTVSGSIPGGVTGDFFRSYL